MSGARTTVLLLLQTLLLLTVLGVSTAEDADQLALPSTLEESPLAQLLATASGAGAILPLAPHLFRPKRKPQRFRPDGAEGRPRFKPRNKVQQEQLAPETNEILTTEPTARKKFTGFQRRPRPGPRPAPVEIEPTILPEPTTTLAPKIQIEDFFGTPEPVLDFEVSEERKDLEEPAPTVPVPDPFINSISDERNLLDEVRARTIVITGAQAVGVTKDVSSRSKGGRQLSQPSSPAAPLGPVPSSPRKTGRKPGATRPRAEPRPEQELSGRAVPAPRGRAGSRNRGPENVVGTVERYRFQNEDGSITWGYENDDGSYKEESIGVDCVTRGKYGYIDPTGEVREYTYTGGVRCDPLTRQIESTEETREENNDRGFFDYTQNKFVMPDGRRVTVVVNPGNKARGRRY